MCTFRINPQIFILTLSIAKHLSSLLFFHQYPILNYISYFDTLSTCLSSLLSQKRLFCQSGVLKTKQNFVCKLTDRLSPVTTSHRQNGPEYGWIRHLWTQIWLICMSKRKHWKTSQHYVNSVFVSLCVFQLIYCGQADGNSNTEVV